MTRPGVPCGVPEAAARLHLKSAQAGARTGNPASGHPPKLKTPPQPPREVQLTQAQANPDFQSLAEAILDRTKRYPREAMLSGTEGQVVLQFVVNSQGTVLGYSIERLTGSDVLDHEVVRMLHARASHRSRPATTTCARRWMSPLNSSWARARSPRGPG